MRSIDCRGWWSILVLTLTTSPMNAGPTLEELMPPVGQRAKTFTVLLSGYQLEGPEQVILYRPGLKAERIERLNGTEVRVTLRAAEDCPLGEHPLRLRTRTGISELKTVRITPFTVVKEQAENDTLEQAQPLAWNRTVYGSIPSGDVDVYRLTANKGQRISAEVEAIRLGRTLFDAILTLRDASGKVLVQVDDTALGRQDPVLTTLAPQSGDYFLEIRETNREGSDQSLYCLHVGDYPRPMVAFPNGGPASKATEIRFLGDARGEFSQTLTLPSAAKADHVRLYPSQDDQFAPTGLPFRVVPFGNEFEVEPNDQAESATRVEMTIPVAVNGIISTGRDVDWFRHPARKGQLLRYRLFAEDLGSPLDSSIVVYTAEGKLLGRNDDGLSHDSYLEVQIPADGDYLLGVRDQRNQGSPQSVYRVEITEAISEIALFKPRVQKRLNESQVVSVPRGNRVLNFVGVRRHRCAGPVRLQVGDLPAGVIAHHDSIPADAHATPIVFSAADNAPRASQLATIEGSLTQGSMPLTARLRHSIDLVHGTADTLYHRILLDRLAVAVVDPVPFRLSLTPPTVPLGIDGSMDLEIRVERAADFNESIQVTLPVLAPWVEGPNRVTIPADQDTIVYPIQTLPEAQPGRWPLVAQAEAPVGDGYVRVASELTWLEIGAPWITGQINPGVIEKGKTGTLQVTLDKLPAFPGEATATLDRLPPSFKVSPVRFTSDQRQLTFTVAVPEASLPDDYNEVFCVVTFPVNQATLRQNVGRPGLLRVTAPGEKLLDAQGRPLSRLELLRRQRSSEFPRKPPRK